MSLGKLITFNDYFDQASASDSGRLAEADEYVPAYLRRSVEANERDPISCWSAYWRVSTALADASSMAALALATSRSAQPELLHLRQEIVRQRGCLRRAIYERLSDEQVRIATALLQDAHAALIASVAGSIAGSNEAPAVAMFNCHSATQRMHLADLAVSGAAAGRLYSAGSDAGREDVVVDVPNCGFTVLPLAVNSRPPLPEKVAGSKKSDSLLAAEEEQHFVLRTEFFESRIDKQTGALAAMYDYYARGNRCSQRVVWRSSEMESVQMLADDVRIEYATHVAAKICSRGRLVSNAGETLAQFEQSFATFRGSRCLESKLSLSNVRTFADMPWENYVGLRTAWPNELCELYRCANEIRSRTERQRFESPLFVEVADGDRRTALLTDGLPYHQRAGDRALDTLLIVANESTREFCYALGVDVQQPLLQATERLAAVRPVACSLSNPNDVSSGWLCHVDSKRVVAEDWRPLALGGPDEGHASSVGHVKSMAERAGEGVSFSLAERTGRDVVVTIRLFRPVSQAGKVGSDGSSDGECKVTDGAIRVTMAANEWTRVEARW